MERFTVYNAKEEPYVWAVAFLQFNNNKNDDHRVQVKGLQSLLWHWYRAWHGDAQETAI